MPPLHPRRAARATLPSTAAGVLLLLAGAAATMAVRAADDKKQAAAPKPALTVTVVQPQRSELPLSVAANGNVAAWQEAIVGSESSGWRLAEVRANVGDVVKRGQVLAVFSTDIAQADLAQTRASVIEAEATAADAAANAARARELQATGALSAQQINQYYTAERTAQARLEAQRAVAKVTQLRLAQTSVLAPDSGVISARSATVGAVVGAGQELFRLIRQGRLEWRAEVASSDLGQVRPGQTVRLSAAGGTVVEGTVRMVAPTVDAATRNGLVYVDLPTPAGGKRGAASVARTVAGTGARTGARTGAMNGDQSAATTAPLVRAGMFARGEFVLGSSGALTLPQTAVLLRDGFSYVFKVGSDSKVSQAKVTVGRRAADRIEITGGLDADARVVANGAGFLADGDVVKVVAGAPAIAPPSPPSPSSATGAAPAKPPK